MRSITGEFVAKLATIWHRFTLPEEDHETLADMLVPMDEAGSRVVAGVESRIWRRSLRGLRVSGVMGPSRAT